MIVSFKKVASALAAVIVLGVPVPQRIASAAGIPVIDVAAIAQLIQQIT